MTDVNPFSGIHASDEARTTTERLEGLLGLIIFLSPCITAFVLAAFSSLKQFRQPAKLFVNGFANGDIAAFIGGLGMLRGMIGGRGLLFTIGLAIVLGVFFSFLASSEAISEKKTDELVEKVMIRVGGCRSLCMCSQAKHRNNPSTNCVLVSSEI